MKKLFVLLFLAVALTAAAGCVSTDTTQYPEIQPDMAPLLDEIVDCLHAECDASVNRLYVSSEVLTNQILWGEEFEQTLKRLYADIPYSISVTYFNISDGKSAVYPTGTEAHFDIIDYAADSKKKSYLRTIETDLHGNVVLLSVPVYTQSGDICGGLYCAIEVLALPDMALSQVPASEGYYLTIDSEATSERLYHPTSEGIGLPAPYRVSSLKNEAGEYSYVDASGIPVSAVYKKRSFLNEAVIVSLNYRTELPLEPIFSPNSSKENLTLYVSQLLGNSNLKTMGDLIIYVNRLQTEGRQYPIFVISSEGVILATSEPDLAGTDISGRMDAYIVPFQRLDAIMAQRGGGYSVSYLTVLPETAVFQGRPVLNFIVKIDESAYVIAYMPLREGLEAVDIEKKNVVEQAGSDSLLYAMKYGEQALFTAVTERKMPYSDKAECIIVAYDGVLLADSLNPKQAGTDGFGVKDAFGMSFIRNVVSMSELGSCNMYYCYPNPSGDEQIIYLCALEILSGTGIVCTMVPISEISV